MSPVDPSTAGSGTPKALDGREYPEHLRLYHKYDIEFLPIVARLQPATFDDLSVAVEDRRTRAALPRWLASARWRGLVEIDESAHATARRYVVAREGVSSAA